MEKEISIISSNQKEFFLTVPKSKNEFRVVLNKKELLELFGTLAYVIKDLQFSVDEEDQDVLLDIANDYQL